MEAFGSIDPGRAGHVITHPHLVVVVEFHIGCSVCTRRPGNRELSKGTR